MINKIINPAAQRYYLENQEKRTEFYNFALAERKHTVIFHWMFTLV